VGVFQSIGGDGTIPRVDQMLSDRDQTLTDADQTASDTDQATADEDQAAADEDQAAADLDQVAAERDQETADREHDTGPALTEEAERDYASSRIDRIAATSDRLGNRLRRAHAAHDRSLTADERDRTGDLRDEHSRERDDHAADMADGSDADHLLIEQLASLRAASAADRERARLDRLRAAQDRAAAAMERARLESELRLAHLDELTGAYRREMGRLAIAHEIDRARRSDGRFIVAFVDVDRLKQVNDSEGHAAGDRVLQIVVRDIRHRLRSFDPIMRFGGDEFVCGLGGTDLAEAERRFEEIADAIQSDAGVGISVGMAMLEDGDSADDLTERADVVMLSVKALHHAAA
jgi:diguanylate cyclase (GGDEF)-like protein